MISLQTASSLKQAGLVWKPAMLDHFAIPDRHMDDRVFVISDILVTVDILQGMQVVSFQGASEWALDSLVTSEIVWMPDESQLRQTLEGALLETVRPEFRLVGILSGYRCEFIYQGQFQSFESKDASEAYAAAILFVLTQKTNAASSGDG